MFSSALGNIQDEVAVENLFAQVKPQFVFHAAAYKHVPIVEDNVIEGIRNNIFGTRVVADAALRHGVDKFVLISTDKTVNPTNVMGTTKRVAELYCQALNRDEGRTSSPRASATCWLPAVPWCRCSSARSPPVGP